MAFHLALLSWLALLALGLALFALLSLLALCPPLLPSLLDLLEPLPQLLHVAKRCFQILSAIRFAVHGALRVAHAVAQLVHPASDLGLARQRIGAHAPPHHLHGPAHF